MQMNWTTFVFEILNFFLLLWILRRFLYRPVLAMIERRQADLEQRQADIRRKQSDAATLEAEYRRRLEDWQGERESARQELQQALAAERVQQLEQLREELAGERDRAGVLRARALQEATRSAEALAIRQGASFCARLLAPLACPPLEHRLASLMLAELATLDPERQEAMRASAGAAPLQSPTIVVCSVWALPDELRAGIEQALSTLLKRPCAIDYRQDPTLLAGLRITFGPWVLGANLHDELHAFAETESARELGT